VFFRKKRKPDWLKNATTFILQLGAKRASYYNKTATALIFENHRIIIRPKLDLLELHPPYRGKFALAMGVRIRISERETALKMIGRLSLPDSVYEAVRKVIELRHPEKPTADDVRRSSRDNQTPMVIVPNILPKKTSVRPKRPVDLETPIKCESVLIERERTHSYETPVYPMRSVVKPNRRRPSEP